MRGTFCITLNLHKIKLIGIVIIIIKCGNEKLQVNFQLNHCNVLRGGGSCKNCHKSEYEPDVFYELS